MEHLFAPYYSTTVLVTKICTNPMSILPYQISMIPPDQKVSKAEDLNHKHLRNIDCLKVHTACLVCFVGTVNGHHKKEALKEWRK
jgi:hypothetical protein